MNAPSHAELSMEELPEAGLSSGWVGVICVLGYAALCGLVYLLH